MAYAAVTSLYHTIDLLLISRIFVASSTQEILKSAQLSAKQLQGTLIKYNEIKNNSEGMMAADARIRDEARKLEDAIEFDASAQFISQSQSNATLSLNLDHLRHDIDCFGEAAKKMGSEYMEELYKPAPEEEADAVSSPTDAAENQCDMVGSSDHFRNFRDEFVLRNIHISITGMTGIGKTTFAKKLLNDSLVKEKFECRAFVRVGQKYEFEDILQAILAQLNVEMIMEGDENIQEYFKRNLMGRKLLIVLDDVWDPNLLGNCWQLMSKGIFVVTSRIRNIFPICLNYNMRFLNEEESWELLRRKVFGEGECPPLLVKAGKEIAENCEGLPLLILSIAQLLQKAPKNPQYWKEAAEMKNSVFDDACDQIYELLLPSYHHLTQHSKACFLYIAVFPKDYVVRRSRIINLWRAERFVDDQLGYVLHEIVSNNLVVNSEPRHIWGFKPKAFKLHVVYRHLCKREGKNIKFLCILNRYADADGSIEDMRHLAIYHNTLLAIKEVHISITSVSTLRSVLCTGPYHQYQVPIICLELRLLRLLDALNIRFYEFPVDVVKQIQLRYLSLTTNAKLPTFIHKLWFLQFLILHQHLRINRGVAESYVPVEIWELQQLEHLQIIGRNLPHPPPGAILPNLTELLDVGVQSCTKGVLESMPNLEKLRIQIELAPDDAQTMSCFDDIICPEKLRSLGSVVLNPNLLPKPTVPLRLLSFSISSVRKLSLSGFGYPWEDMAMITQLPYLRELKVRCYAFRGEKWEAKEMRFENLKHLLIEDTDLVQWTAVIETFQWLRHLTLKNCHKLQEIPLYNKYTDIQLVDCNPLVQTWARQNDQYNVRASYSWK